MFEVIELSNVRVIRQGFHSLEVANVRVITQSSYLNVTCVQKTGVIRFGKSGRKVSKFTQVREVRGSQGKSGNLFLKS